MFPFSQNPEHSDNESEFSPGPPSSNRSGRRSGARKPASTPRQEETRRWLSIDAACKMIGVDQSTLRRWSDSGKIPVFRTPGGHRRYSQDDLNAFLSGDSRPKRRMSRQLLTDMSMAGYEPDYLDAATRLPWYQAYDVQTLQDLRLLGRQMVELTMSYISGRGDRKQILHESRDISREYGRRSAEAGLTTAEALEAFLFFRRPVFNAVNQYIEQEKIGSRRSCRIMSELTAYMDDVLLATIQAHEEATC